MSVAIAQRGAVLASMLAAITGCAVDGAVVDEPAPVLERVWADTIHRGDVIVLVPGTGAVDYLGTPIEAMPGDRPRVDVLTEHLVMRDSVVFEQAIGAAHRAGFTNQDLESGALTFLLWGAGFHRLESFDYVSYERATIRIDILGGTNSCGVGLITDNYLNYSKDSAQKDATDLYTRLSGWLAAHPATGDRNVVVASHSWGGAVAEYLSLEHDAFISAQGELPAGNHLPFTIAAGVPGFILGYTFIGPRALTFERPEGTRTLYEIDRPDDPVHALTFDGDFDGHYYNIVWGSDFRGAYGVTTEDLSCNEVPGPCRTPGP